MKFMSEKFEQQLKKRVEKVSLKAGENMIDGRRCTFIFFEPQIPLKVLKHKKTDN